MKFESDDEALELLARYGYDEIKNGVIRLDQKCLAKDCRDAVEYLCDEWDFTTEFSE